MAILDGDILRVSLNFELGDGTLYQNIYHYIRDGTDPFSDAAHITAISSALATAYAEINGLVRNDVTEQLSSVDRIEWVTDAWVLTENIGTFTMTWVPGGAGEGLPYQSAPYVIFKTERPRSIGKKFLFPFTEAAQDETILTAGSVTSIVEYAADIVTSIILGGDATLTAGIPRTGVNTWFNFLVAVVPDLLGSQRRRRPGVGA